jgi:hypothetical protein
MEHYAGIDVSLESASLFAANASYILRLIQPTQPFGNIHGDAPDPPLAASKAYAASRIG